MKAIIASSGACSLTERPIPSPLPGQLLLRVAYSAINRADTLQRKGLYPAPPGATDILGLEAVGTVAALGEGVAAPAVGSRVMALLSGGGNAEWVTVPASHTLPVPASLSLRTAAAIPETWLTAFQLLFMVAAPHQRIGPGCTVVVHAAASGVGTAAVQLAAAAGARVVAVASSEEKLAAVRALGAAEGVNYKAEPATFASRLQAAVGSGGAQVILDPVGASAAQANAGALAMDSVWVLYGSMGGLKLTETDILGSILRKRCALVGTTLRTRSDSYKAELVARFAAEALPGLASGALKPIIDSEFLLEATGEAHALMEANGTIGKLLLRVAGEEGSA